MKSFRYGITIQRKKSYKKGRKRTCWKFQALVMGLQNADIENNIFIKYGNLWTHSTHLFCTVFFWLILAVLWAEEWPKLFVSALAPVVVSFGSDSEIRLRLQKKQLKLTYILLSWLIKKKDSCVGPGAGSEAKTLFRLRLQQKVFAPCGSGSTSLILRQKADMSGKSGQ
jgi:hypothetical protein